MTLAIGVFGSLWFSVHGSGAPGVHLPARRCRILKWKGKKEVKRSRYWCWASERSRYWCWPSERSRYWCFICMAHWAVRFLVFGYKVFGLWLSCMALGLLPLQIKTTERIWWALMPSPFPKCGFLFGSSYFWVLGPWVFGWFGPSNPVGSVKHIVNQLVRTYVLRFLGCGTSAALQRGCFLFLLK